MEIYFNAGIGMKNMYNNRINSDWQFRCAPLPACYAERYVFTGKIAKKYKHSLK
jgi:hypothetical protein